MRYLLLFLVFNFSLSGFAQKVILDENFDVVKHFSIHRMVFLAMENMMYLFLNVWMIAGKIGLNPKTLAIELIQKVLRLDTFLLQKGIMPILVPMVTFVELKILPT